MLIRSTRLTAIANAVRNRFYGSALNLRFDNTSELDPRITFSRTSNATQFDSAGNLVYAPHNLLTFSEQFDNAAFTKVNSTVTANTEVAPNGTTTADLMAGSAGTSTKYVFSQFSTTSTGVYTASVYAKAGTESFVVVRITDNTGANAARQRFNLATGAKDGSVGIEGTVTSGSSDITAVGNGWYRCSITTTFNSALTLIQANFWLNSYASVSLTTNLLFWGAQLNIGTLQPYYPTTVKNALGYSQEFDNAAWTKTNSTITANATAAPDGSVTADKLVEDTANAAHFVQSASLTAQSGTAYTFSCYAKAAGRSRFELLAFALTLTGRGFDLSNGTTFTNTAGLSEPTASSITPVGNGWYRCSVTANGSGLSSTVRAYLNNGTTFSYTGDGTSGIFIWGAQLSDSASLDPYVYNPVAAPTAAAYYGPRFDYDPATLAPRGLLIEEQRTNSIRNNTMQGAVAGTPGTLPTNWATYFAPTGITRTVVGVGISNGITYVDLRINGTASGAGELSIYPEGASSLLFAAGTVLSQSVWLAIAGGSTSNISSVQLRSISYLGGSYLSESNALVALTSALTRFALNNYTLAPTADRLTAAYSVNVAAAGAIDITLRIGLPQVEQGAFATSVIPTTTAAATRTADNASMIGANFSNWYRQDEGTMFVEGSVAFPVSGTNQFLMRANDNTYNNSNAILVSDGGVLRIATAAGGVFDGLAGTASALANVTFKTAGAYKTNDLGISSNGGAVSTDATATIPLVMTRMDFGSDHAGFNRVRAGYLRRIAYFPRRLANSELQTVTL